MPNLETDDFDDDVDTSTLSTRLGFRRMGNLWYCDTRCGVMVFHKEKALQIFAFLVTLVGSVCHYALVNVYFLSAPDVAYGAVLLVLNVLTFVVATAASIIATLTDPGVLPRVPSWKVPPITNPLANALYTHVLLPENSSMTLKWCRTCNFYRPPRAIHCRKIDCCVDEMDHYCPWIGNTVGSRNYKYFLVYIFTLSAHIALALGTGVAVTVVEFQRCGCSFTGADLDITAVVAGITMASVSLLWGFFVYALSGFHCKLIVDAHTTNEYHKTSAKRNYFNMGSFCGNLGRSMCRSSRPSFLTQRTMAQWRDETVARVRAIEQKNDVINSQGNGTRNQSSDDNYRNNKGSGADVMDMQPTESRS